MKQIVSSTRSLQLLTGISRAAGVLCLAAAGAILLPQTVSAQGAFSGPAAHFSAAHATAKNTSQASTTVSNQPMDPEDAANAVLADTFMQMREQVDNHFHKGEYNHIVNLERIVVQGEPGDYHAYEDSAWLLWSMTRNDDAIAFLKQGLKANPDTFELYDELGSHYLTLMKDPKDALPYFEKAVTFKCPFFTWHNLAHCYEKTNQWDKAVKAWQTATQYPEDNLAPVRLRRAQAELARRQGQAITTAH